MRALGPVTVGLVAGVVALAGCAGPDAEPAPTEPGEVPVVSPTPPVESTAEPERVVPSGAAGADRPLAGRVVVVDPGHQLGNRHHAAEINAPVDAGGLTKPCNTTGAATDAGYPEASLTWQVAQTVRRELERLGAAVVLTRDTNSDSAWGPCIDERGSVGNPDEPGPTADLRLSIHADGSEGAGDHGFHVIRPGGLAGWTDDIEADSAQLAGAVRDALVDGGFATSTYAGVDGIDERTDLGTLNHSDVPAVLVELGNLRDAGDAALMTSAAGQRRYARALVAGVEEALAGAPGR